MKALSSFPADQENVCISTPFQFHRTRDSILISPLICDSEVEGIYDGVVVTGGYGSSPEGALPQPLQGYRAAHFGSQFHDWRFFLNFLLKIYASVFLNVLYRHSCFFVMVTPKVEIRFS